MKKWSIIQTETLLVSKWLTIKKEKVATNRGYVIDEYYIGERNDVAMIAALFPENRIVLIKEYKHGCDDYVWQLPAGNIEDGNTPLETAKRELREEAGLSAGSYQNIGSWFVSPPWLTNKVHLFLAEDLKFSGKQDLEVTEEIEVKFVDFDIAINMVLNNKIKDAHSALAILYLSSFYLSASRPK